MGAVIIYILLAIVVLAYMGAVIIYILLAIFGLAYFFYFFILIIGPYEKQLERSLACIERRYNWVVDNLFGPVIILLSAYILYLAVTVGSSTFTY